MYNSKEQNSAVKAAKSMFGSPLYLVGAITYSVYGFFGLLGSFLGSSYLNIIAKAIREEAGPFLYYKVQSYVEALNTAAVVSGIIGMLPALVILAGIWVIFGAAKNKKREDMDVTGFAIVRVVVIIDVVITCVKIAFYLILGIVILAAIGGAAAEADVFSSAMPAIAGVILFALVSIAVIVLKLVYYLKLNGTIQVMRGTITSGRADDRISKYVQVFCYIFGVFSAISAIGSLITLYIWGFLANATLSATYIIFAIFLMQYRISMEQQMGYGYGVPPQDVYQEPAYQEPVQQPVYQEPMQQPSYQQPVQQPSYQQPAQQPAYQEPVRQSSYQQQEGSYNETTVLPYYNETSVLSGQFMTGGRMQLVRMTRQKTGETFCISKPSFWIGKDPANVDYCIKDNNAVSRRHVLVTIQNSNCYVRDNHSTNRTYINGQAIQTDTDTLVSNGDRVSLGDEEFVVSIE